MEIVSQSFSEVKSQFFINIFQEGVNEGSWECDEA